MERIGKIIENGIPYLFASARHEDVDCINHIHVNMEIVLVTEGTLHMTVGGKAYAIKEGYGVFIPPLVAHSFSSYQSNQCHVLMFSNGLVDYFFEYVQTHVPQNHVFAVSRASSELCEKILPDENNVTDCIGAEAVLASLCYDVHRGCDFEVCKTPFDRTAYNMIEYIDSHFREKLTLASVARAVGVHPVTVSKIFPKQMGITFNDYLQYVRCAYAAKLIKMQNTTLSEAAYEAGFGCIRSFNRSFLNVYKITPSEYKKTFAVI